MTLTPDEIYERSATEGARRLSATVPAMAGTGFLAGVTIVFGIIALGIVHGLVAEAAGEGVAKLAGALAFGIGLVFTVIGRADLFTENFLDPVAAVIVGRPGATWTAVGRMWLIILVFNLVGGAALSLLIGVENALPNGAPEALIGVASDVIARGPLPSFTNAVAAGALLTLMTYLLAATESTGGRIALAYFVGVFLAIGPFNHVVVTGLHLFIGSLLGADVGIGEMFSAFAVSIAGNFVGGLVLITLAQTVRAKAE